MKKIVLMAAALVALHAPSAFAQDDARAESRKNPKEIAMKKTEAMTKELDLNEEQREAVMQINIQNAQMESRNQEMNPERKEELKRRSEMRYKEVLTPEQFKKYQANNRKQEEKGRQTPVESPADADAR